MMTADAGAGVGTRQCRPRRNIVSKAAAGRRVGAKSTAQAKASPAESFRRWGKLAPVSNRDRLARVKLLAGTTNAAGKLGRHQPSRAFLGHEPGASPVQTRSSSS